MRQKRKLWAYKGAAMKHTTTFRQKDNGWQLIISFKEAEAELLREIKKAPRPIDRSANDITLVEFCRTYLNLKKSIALGTKRNYINAVNSLQDVANKPMRMITYLDLQTAISNWNMKPATQRQYLSKLSILFRAAVHPYGIISTNFIPDIEIAKGRSKVERMTITEEQFRQLMVTTTGDVQLALAICYYTGVRRGELLGLAWPDIEGQMITISKQLDTQHYIYTDPKTKNSFRSIPIPLALVKMLNEYRRNQPLDIHRRLFPRPYGTYYGMKAAMKTIDSHLSPHCLRHTYATHLLAKGMDIRTVAALLGDDTKTVINTYIHYSDDMRTAAANDIEKIFAGNF